VNPLGNSKQANALIDDIGRRESARGKEAGRCRRPRFIGTLGRKLAGR
jgi:hypothetical protein